MDYAASYRRGLRNAKKAELDQLKITDLLVVVGYQLSKATDTVVTVSLEPTNVASVKSIIVTAPVEEVPTEFSIGTWTQPALGFPVKLISADGLRQTSDLSSFAELESSLGWLLELAGTGLLLSNPLPIPVDAILDEDGLPILDEDGNFILAS